jgi:hypothetical protein
MRSFAIVLVTMLLAACGKTSPLGGGGGPDGGINPDGALPPPERGFQIVTPTIDIAAGDEVTYCYYFRAPNTTELSIKRWASRMTPGSHHMIVYLTPTDRKTPGTMSTESCGFLSGGTGTAWTYAAQNVLAELALPADDGTGVPVGQPIRAQQSGFIQMHYLNAGDNVLRAHVELNAYAYDEGVQVTPAGPYVTYNTEIDLAAGSPTNPTKGEVSGNCDVPLEAGSKPAKFYTLSTHSHKQSVHTFVKDGANMVFESTDWDSPDGATWSSAPFFSFTSGKLTYQCEYRNPTNRVIQTGDSAETEEMCMAIGYYFPATGNGHFCLNDTLVY